MLRVQKGINSFSFRRVLLNNVPVPPPAVDLPHCLFRLALAADLENTSPIDPSTFPMPSTTHSVLLALRAAALAALLATSLIPMSTLASPLPMPLALFAHANNRADSAQGHRNTLPTRSTNLSLRSTPVDFIAAEASGPDSIARRDLLGSLGLLNGYYRGAQLDTGHLSRSFSFLTGKAA
jgi:hypothetical protein